MKHQISAIIVAAGIFLSACHSKKETMSNDGQSAYINEAQKLLVRLDPGPHSRVKGQMLLSFTVINNTNRPLRFCKWETPFEPRIGKYFEITDIKGEEAQFRGAMARRVMPPPASAFTTVPAHSNVKTVINLADSYQLNGHRYAVKYTGGGVSGLRSGNKITLVL